MEGVRVHCAVGAVHQTVMRNSQTSLQQLQQGPPCLLVHSMKRHACILPHALLLLGNGPGRPKAAVCAYLSAGHCADQSTRVPASEVVGPAYHTPWCGRCCPVCYTLARKAPATPAQKQFMHVFGQRLPSFVQRTTAVLDGWVHACVTMVAWTISRRIVRHTSVNLRLP